MELHMCSHGSASMQRKPRKDAQETQQRLLAAAAEVFAERGFWEATHAEICEKAKANIAAMNYHFGSKEQLYVEAWRHAFERAVASHPPDGGVRPDAPLTERLHGRILAFMERMGDPANRAIEMMHKEMATPTGLLGEAMHAAIEPMRRDSQAIVRGLLGETASEEQVCLCEMSIFSQCFGPMLHARRSGKAHGAPAPRGPMSHMAVEELAEHITRFSLAGIRGIRAEARRRNPGGRTRHSGKLLAHQG